MILSGLMARPYGEPVEVITEPVPARSPFIPLDAKMVVGVVDRPCRTRCRSFCFPASSTG